MAKVSFTKLGLAQNKTTKTINYNEQDIEVKQYLPVNDKLGLISRVINLSADENNFANPMKVSVYTVLEIINAYTNISFTEKQKEDPCKIYDMFVSNGLSNIILKAIPEDELAELLIGIEDSVKTIYDYRNSIFGILEALNQDYSNINFDLSNIQQVLKDNESVGFLKDLMPLISGQEG